MRNPTSNIVSGRQLRAARVLAGLTQAQLAQQAGFPAAREPDVHALK